MIGNKFQRELDKKRLLWYNTRRDVRKVLTMDDILEGVLSYNKEKTKEIRGKLLLFGEILSTISKGLSPALRSPIIAGGSIRDMAFGINPKDFDIFFDTSGVPEDERDDLCVLLGTLFLDELKTREGYEFIDVTYLAQTENDESYARTADWKDFIVYSSYGWVNEVDWREPSPDACRGTRFQFVGHNDRRLTENPKEFLSSFDWELVKCFYDTEDHSFYFDEEFHKALKTREIKVTSQVTFNRIDSWLTRLDIENKHPPIKVVNKIDKRNIPKHTLADFDIYRHPPFPPPF